MEIQVKGGPNRVIVKSHLKGEATNAIQNAYTWLESMDAFSEMTDEQIDIHQHIAYVMESEESKIVKYILRLAKKYQHK